MIKISDSEPESDKNQMYILEKETELEVLTEDDLEPIKEGLTQCLKEPDGMAVGKYFRIAAIDENGHAVLEAVDAPQGDVTDVTINGVSAVKNGVAAIAMAPSYGGKAGVVIINGSSRSGFTYNGYGELVINTITDTQISARKNGDGIGIRLDHLDKAVKAAMTDGKGAAWTPEEQLAGRQRLGLDKEWTLKGTITTENKASQLPVDLTGCTDIAVKGYITATGTGNLLFKVNGTNIVAVSGYFGNGIRNTFFTWRDSFFGVEPVQNKYAASKDATAMGAVINSSMLLGVKISDITHIILGSTDFITECNIEIYAR